MREIAAGTVTRKAAAKRLGRISERQVNRLMKAHGVRRPPSKTREARDLSREQADERRRKRQFSAESVVVGLRTLEEAASNAGCSPRTMYRWVSLAKKTHISEQNHRKNKKNERKTGRNRRK